MSFTLKDGATRVGAVNSVEDLTKAISDKLKSEGKSEDIYDLGRAIEVKSSMSRLETKANEVIHSTNTGFGAELVPGAIQTTDFLDLAPKLNPLLGQFRGFHGRNMPKLADVPAIGELPLHILGGEWTTGGPLANITQGLGKLPTDKIRIEQKKLLFSVDVADEEVRYVTIFDILTKIQTKLAESSARTTISSIINGDTATGANTNINLIDGTPTGTEAYLGWDGLRKKALASATTSFDAGTFGYDDFIKLLNALGENASDDSNLVWLFSRYSHNVATTLPEFMNQYQNGRSSTIVTGQIPPFHGIDVTLNRYLGKANSAGKVSATAGNNSKGQVMLLHKDAVQYGYNGDYSIELFRVPGYGWQVFGYYYMGFGIASGNAGLDPMVASLYNIS